EYADRDENTVREHVVRLKREIELLSGGADRHSREELARARAELQDASVLLEDVMLKRDNRLSEASQKIDERLRLIEEKRPGEDELREIKLQRSEEHTSELQSRENL